MIEGMWRNKWTVSCSAWYTQQTWETYDLPSWCCGYVSKHNSDQQITGNTDYVTVKTNINMHKTHFTQAAL